jgi:uncharacterized alkaline shock family protein YloU
MTRQTPPPEPRETDLDLVDLDGHTIDELSEYLDADRTPTDFSIESSPGCQIALAALERLGDVTFELLEAQAVMEPAPADAWVQGIMNRIGLEAHAGREIPVDSQGTDARITLTEGAVRGVIRAAGDSVGDVIVGRCELIGDVTQPGAPITVRLGLTVAWGEELVRIAAQVRAAVYRELLKHTDLTIAAVDIAIEDVRFNRIGSAGEDSDG